MQGRGPRRDDGALVATERARQARRSPPPPPPGAPPPPPPGASGARASWAWPRRGPLSWPHRRVVGPWRATPRRRGPSTSRRQGDPPRASAVATARASVADASPDRTPPPASGRGRGGAPRAKQGVIGWELCGSAALQFKSPEKRPFGDPRQVFRTCPVFLLVFPLAFKLQK